MSQPPSDRAMSDILAPREAASFLGITPELLFAYVRNAPKASLGEARTLPFVMQAGCLAFRREDLKAFDDYLWQPWSTDQRRPAIPTFVVDYLKVESGGKCARCGGGFRLQNAHITDWAESHSHHHHNLIRLCSRCHDEIGSGKLIPKGDLAALKQRLILQIRESVARTQWAAGIRRMPTPASGFVGRTADIADLIAKLKCQRSIALTGPGGIGKTQLLLHALTALHNDRPMFWLDIASYGTAEELRFALATGVGGDIKGGPMWAALDDLKARLVFDGIEQLGTAELDTAEDLIQELLCHTRVTQIIITTQANLPGISFDEDVPVPALGLDDGLRIIARAVRSDQAPDRDMHLRTLARYCDGHPLSFQLVAGLLRYFQSASVVLARLCSKGASVLQSPTRKVQNRETSLRVCLKVAHEALNDEERKLLWIVAQFPAGCLCAFLDLSEEYGIVDTDADTAGLQRWHLLDVRMDDLCQRRMYVLSPIRSFVTSEAELTDPAGAETLRAIVVRDLAIQATVLDACLVEEGHVAGGLFRYWQEFPNFVHAFNMAAERVEQSSQYGEWVIAFAHSLMVYCFTHALFHRGCEIMEAGATAAIRRGDSVTASHILLQCVILGVRAHSQTVIVDAVERLRGLAAECKESVVLGDTAMGMATAALAQHEYEVAEQRFLEAVSLYSQTPEWRKCGLAKKELAHAYELQGRLREALCQLKDALQIVRETNDPINAGAMLHHQGNCLAGLGRYDAAMASYAEAVEEFYAIGAAEFLSNALGEIGYLLTEWDMPQPLEHYVRKEQLAAGLADVYQQAARALSLEATTLAQRQNVEIARKLFGIVSLLSFSGCNGLLYDWAMKLHESVVVPLIGQFREGRRVGDEVLLIWHLDLTLLLAARIGAVKQPEGSGPEP